MYNVTKTRQNSFSNFFEEYHEDGLQRGPDQQENNYRQDSAWNTVDISHENTKINNASNQIAQKQPHIGDDFLQQLQGCTWFWLTWYS